MIDPAGRTVDYLRISVTDRCNERCLYCMPEHYSAWVPRADLLTYEEILAIARTGVRLGFKRFRVTGASRSCAGDRGIHRAADPAARGGIGATDDERDPAGATGTPAL